MIDERMAELMQREIDGVVSSKDSAELHRYLAENPQALAYYEELREVDRALSIGGCAAPPADLKDAIVAAARETTGPTPKGGLGATIINVIRATVYSWLPKRPAPDTAHVAVVVRPDE